LAKRRCSVARAGERIIEVEWASDEGRRRQGLGYRPMVHTWSVPAATGGEQFYLFAEGDRYIGCVRRSLHSFRSFGSVQFNSIQFGSVRFGFVLLGSVSSCWGTE
jgi:hypothetical protein